MGLTRKPIEPITFEAIDTSGLDTKIKDVIKAFDVNNNQKVEIKEVDANRNSRIDNLLATTNKLTANQFEAMTAFFHKHGFRFRRTIPIPNTDNDEAQQKKSCSKQNAIEKNPDPTNKAKNQDMPESLVAYLAEAQDKKPRFIPEYKYNKFFLQFSEGRDADSIAIEQFRISAHILDSDPKAEVFLTRASTVGNIDVLIEEYIESIHRDRLHIIEEPVITEKWAQDFGEPTGGKNSLFISGWAYGGFAERERAVYLPMQDIPVNKQDVPFVLQGGNVTKTKLKGKNLLIVGKDDIDDTKKQYKENYDYDISDEMIQTLYEKAFGKCKLLVLENTPAIDGASSCAFHIDQMALFPRPNTVILPRIIYQNEHPSLTAEENDYIRTLEQNKAILEEAGFNVIEIPTSWDMAMECQAFTNSISLKKPSGTTLIMPSFGQEDVEKEIRHILEANGFEVRFSENTTSKLMGNTHCLTGALAMIDTKAQSIKRSEVS